MLSAALIAAVLGATAPALQVRADEPAVADDAAGQALSQEDAAGQAGVAAGAYGAVADGGAAEAGVEADAAAAADGDAASARHREEGARGAGATAESADAAQIPDAPLTLDEYDARLDALAQSLNVGDVELASNDTYVHLLLQRKLVREVGYAALTKAMADDADLSAMVTWLLSDYEMLGYYLYSGAPEANNNRDYQLPSADTWMKSLKVLSALYRAHGDDFKQVDQAATPVRKRIAAAIALTHSVPVTYWTDRLSSASINYDWKLSSDPTGRYEIFKRFHDHGLLVRGFDELSVSELRLVMASPVDNDQLQWANHYYRVFKWGDTDYATAPDEVRYGVPQAFGGMFPYGTYNSRPSKFGGLGDRFYDQAQYATWNAKYGLEAHDACFDYQVPYGYNAAGQVFMPVWVVMDTNGVCAQISHVSAIGYNALGMPCVQIYQPGHASFLVYNRADDGTVTWGSGYDLFGMHQSGKKTAGESYLPTGWSDLPWTSFYNVAYAFIGVDALAGRYGTDYAKAQNLSMMGERELDRKQADRAIELYRKALDAQYINLTAWDGLAEAYEQQGATEQEVLALADEAAEKLAWYPLSVNDYLLNRLTPLLKTMRARTDMVAKTRAALVRAAGSESNNSGLAQPGYCRDLANYCLRNLPAPLGFSFETGAFELAEAYAGTDEALEYSFDAGATWHTWTRAADERTRKLSDAEIAQITDESDIYYRFADSTERMLLEIKAASAPPSNQNANTVNDNEDRFLNVQAGLEYSTDAGASWHPLSAQSTFEGDVTVWIRRRATGVTLASPYTEVVFTKGEGTPERSYIKVNGNLSLVSGPASESSGASSALTIDGKNNTAWVNAWTVPAQSMVQGADGSWGPNHVYEFVYQLAEPHYLSALGYLPGNADGAIRACEVYTSEDGTSWQLAASVDGWRADTAEKSIEFAQPAWARYIKVRTTRVGTKEYQPVPSMAAVTVGYASVAEFRFYENYAVKNCTPTELAVDASAVGTCKVGDRLDVSALSATVTFDDGSRVLVPASALALDTDIFSQAGMATVEATYEGLSTSFAVPVLAREQAPTAIEEIALADRVYYAGDTVDPRDVTVRVGDGTESWYLLPGSYSVEGTLVAGAQQVTVRAGELTGTVSVTAAAAPISLTVSTDDAFKQKYSLGDAFDPSGMTVTLASADGSVQQLDTGSYDLAVIDASEGSADIDTLGATSGAKTVRVSLKHKPEVHADVDVTVLPYLYRDGFVFEATEGATTCTLTGYTPEADAVGVVEIPAAVTVGGASYAVTGIAGGAFSSASSTTAISLPASVRSIEAGAFSACSELRHIYMTGFESLDGFSCEDGAFAQVDEGYVYLPQQLAGASSPIAGYQVASVAAQAVSLELTVPDKISYVLGEELDTSGMELRAVMADGTSAPTLDYELSGFDGARTGAQTVTVTLRGSKLAKTFEVQVAFPEVAITAQPAGKAYLTGQQIEPLEVAATAGGSELSYRWYRGAAGDGTDEAVAGATQASFTPREAGSYYVGVYVRDAAGAEGAQVFSDVVTISVGDFAAEVDGVGYTTLDQALASSSDKDLSVRLLKDIALTAPVQIGAGRTVAIDGGGHALVRSGSFAGALVEVGSKASLVLGDVALDGGARWGGAHDEVLNRGTVNSGLSATAPLVSAAAGSAVTVGKGAILRNNATTGEASALVLNGATAVFDGGILRDNMTSKYGAVRGKGNSSIEVIDGKAEGNQTVSNGVFHAEGSCAVTVRAGTFRNNRCSDAKGCGGVISSSGRRPVLVAGGTFTNNAADRGSVIFMSGGTGANLTVTDAVFESNRSTGDAGAIWAPGGGTIMGATFARNRAAVGAAVCSTGGITFDSCTFTGNVAMGDGGAIKVSETPTIRGCTFENNSARRGGAIWTGVKTVVDASTFTANTAAEDGGALWAEADLRVADAAFTANTAERTGGAVHAAAQLTSERCSYDGNAAQRGGAAWVGAAFTLNGGSLVGNTADAGAGAWLDAADAACSILALDQAQEIRLAALGKVQISGNLGSRPVPFRFDGTVEKAAQVGTVLGAIEVTGATLNGGRLESQAGKLVLADGWLDVSSYRGGDGMSAPAAPAGTVFAGWFTTDDPARMGVATALPASATTGVAYAKFVDAQILTVKRQVTTRATADSTTVNLRLLSSVDSLAYRSVGFDVSVNGGAAARKQTSTVFQAVDAGTAEGVSSLDPTQVFGAAAHYFTAYEYRSIRQAQYGTSFFVTPFWVTLDGTEVLGASRTFTVQDALDAGQAAYEAGQAVR